MTIQHNIKTFLIYAFCGFFAWGIFGGNATVAIFPIEKDLPANHDKESKEYASVFFRGNILWAVCGFFFGIWLFMIENKNVPLGNIILTGVIVSVGIAMYLETLRPPDIATNRPMFMKSLICIFFSVLASVSSLALRWFILNFSDVMSGKYFGTKPKRRY